ncbi:MAG: response regulator [Limisphaerales bacterium]
MTITVSIVEDDPGLRESVAQYIDAARGFRCIGAHASGEEAVKRIPVEAPSVVVMDINLTGMDGVECTRRLKAAVPSVQILMLTVFDDTEQIYRALAAGASGYLLKRVPPPKLLEALREVHGGGAPMSGPIARKVVQSFQKPAAAGDDTDALSPREREVLECLAQGLLYKQISERLGISVDTIRTYIRRIYEKLHVRNRTEAVARFLRP